MNPNLKRMLAQRAKTNADAASGIKRVEDRQLVEQQIRARKGEVFLNYLESIGVEEFAARHLGIPKIIEKD